MMRGRRRASIFDLMRHAELQRVSMRAALAAGFAVTVGLWLYTGYDFAQRIETVQQEAAAIAARYTRSQELLSSVRTQVLLNSVRVRDALLDPQPAQLQDDRRRIEASVAAMKAALADYEPIVATGNDAAIAGLADELEQFRHSSLDVLADAAGKTPAEIRDALNRHISPRRDAALRISEEIQALNRAAFIRQQADVDLVHREAGLRSRDRLGVALVIGLGVLLMTSLYAGRLEARLRAQLDRDARISNELQQVAAKVLNAQEEERRRIARELHDEVGQALTAIRVELDVAERTIEAAGGSAAPLAEAQRITDGALQTVRNVTQLLHPSALDDLGLSAVLEASLRRLARQDIRGELRQVNVPPRLSREIELAAYRIVQEGLTNVARHSQARWCLVRLTGLDGRLLVEVEDDGIGFVEDIDRPIVARGLGLVSIRERAARLGGSFSIASGDRGGTRLVVTLPEPTLA
jgi:signal transduction histidine kinase